MIIKKILYQHRNDFKAIFKCDQCGYEQEGWGYSDEYFYNTVLPNALCVYCSKNSHGENPDQLRDRLGRIYVLDMR